tara:strand:+ start:9474 stop:9659 length:186 start_codon:yes stop_codon:yes gene_type:complete
MEQIEILDKLNNLSITSLKEKIEIIEELYKNKEIDFVFIEKINIYINKVMLEWWKTPVIKP